MVRVAVISVNNLVCKTIEKLSKPLNWIEYEHFHSVDQYLNSDFRKFKIIVFESAIIQSDWFYDDYSVSDRVYFVHPEAQLMFLSAFFLNYKYMKKTIMTLFQKSLSLRSISN